MSASNQTGVFNYFSFTVIFTIIILNINNLMKAFRVKAFSRFKGRYACFFFGRGIFDTEFFYSQLTPGSLINKTQ